MGGHNGRQTLPPVNWPKCWLQIMPSDKFSVRNSPSEGVWDVRRFWESVENVLTFVVWYNVSNERWRLWKIDFEDEPLSVTASRLSDDQNMLLSAHPSQKNAGLYTSSPEGEDSKVPCAPCWLKAWSTSEDVSIHSPRLTDIMSPVSLYASIDDPRFASSGDSQTGLRPFPMTKFTELPSW